MKKLIAFIFAALFATGVFAATETVDGVTYTYSISNGEVTIGDGRYSAIPATTSGDLTIPSELGGLPVTKLGSRAFIYCHSLTSVTIPDSVTSIGENAFLWCDSMKSITMPSELISIGENAFGFCESLRSVVIPNGVTLIGDSAFHNCSSLTSVTIPDSVTSIGLEAFEYCSSLTSVTIPNSVTTIGSWAFYGCSSLTSITIPKNVSSIGEDVVGECIRLKKIEVDVDNQVYSSLNGVLYSKDKTKLISCPIGASASSINIPDTVKTIGYRAFFGCAFTSFIIPNGVTTIEREAFYGCSSLKSITLPDSVISIGKGVFTDCFKLSSVKIPSGLSAISDEMFFLCTSLKSITIPNSVTKIGDSAFNGCWSLKSITIPDGVKKIGEDAFADCRSLRSITIPNGVTEIGGWVFGYCESLTSVTIPASVESIGSYAFLFCSSLAKVYADRGDAGRVKELMRGKGVDVEMLKFIEPDDYDDMPELKRVYGAFVPREAIEPIDFLFAADCKISGLPSGLKVVKTTDKKTKEVIGYDIVGTPKKPGLYTIKLTKTVNKVKYEYLTTFEVANYTDANNCFTDEFFAAEDPGNAPGKAVTLYQGVADISALPKLGYVDGVTKLAVSGLPTGLKYNAKTNQITGIPTKIGNFTVTLTVSKGKSKLVSSYFVKVAALPAWAVGTFNGGFLGEENTPVGVANITISSAGKISGKILKREVVNGDVIGLTWTLAAASFDSVDENGAYHATLTAKSGKLPVETYKITLDEYGIEGEGLVAYQNLWKTSDELKTLGKELAVITKSGYDAGDGITLKISSSGAVTATKTYSWGKASCSTTLIPLQGEGYTHVAYIYFAPNAKKGFDGYSTCLYLNLPGESYVDLEIDGLIPDEVTSAFDPITLKLGDEVNWKLESKALTATTIKASGLPKGLKLVQDKNTKVYSIQGVPTAASKLDKQKNIVPSLVKLTVTTSGKNSRVFTREITVIH